jgi:hypothetical protein
MKFARFWLPIVLVVGVFAMAFAADVTKEERDGLLRHVVCFKFKDDADPAAVKKVEDAFVALEEKIPFIVDLEWGTNVSPEGLAHGYTHCFILTFKSAADRDQYLPHPAHKQFGKTLGPVLDKVFVIDFWTK